MDAEQCLLLDQVARHLLDSPSEELALASRWQPPMPLQRAQVLQQVQGLQVAARKFPSLLAQPGVLYPPRVHLEQCTDERVAAARFAMLPPGRAIDLSGGFGIDALALAQAGWAVTHVESNAQLSQLVQANALRCGWNSLSFFEGSAQQALAAGLGPFDLVYVDPSRRGEAGRLHALADCEPQVHALLPAMLAAAPMVCIKASPMCSLGEELGLLPTCHTVQVWAWNGEVKEVTFWLGRQACSSPTLQVHALQPGGHQVLAETWASTQQVPTLGSAGHIVFEPGAALQKAGLANALASAQGMQRHSQSVPLFFGHHAPPALAHWGTLHRVLGLAHSEHELAQHLPTARARLVAYGLADSTEKIRKQLKWKDGQYISVFVLPDGQGKRSYLIAEKILNASGRY